ncbi:MAG: sulfur carrier protein ThiS [Bacteroidales bacterium]|nr:sulfur carrier protein ThiS [Bacteroidales bacterium]
MKIIINSKTQETVSKTVAELAKELNLPDLGVALAVNSEMIPRDKWQEKLLKENDDILIIKAASGG